MKNSGVTPPRKELTPAQRLALDRATRALEKAHEDLDAARARWADLVAELPPAAVSRHLGISRQAVAERLRAIRRSRDSR